LFVVGPTGIRKAWKAVTTFPAWIKKEVHDNDDDDDGDDAAADDDDIGDQNSYNSSSHVTNSTEYLVAQKLGHKIGKFMENFILLFVMLS
jgi:hypothetical protein